MSAIRLTALAALAAAQYPFLQADVAVGDTFVLHLGEDKADEQARTVEYLTVTNQLAEISQDQGDLLKDQPASTAEPTPHADSMQPNASNQAKGAPKKNNKTCRVLQDCALGAVNDIIELGASEVKEGKSLGWIDDDPASVAYAKSLKAKSSAA